jgi:hypothetical protein
MLHNRLPFSSSVASTRKYIFSCDIPTVTLCSDWVDRIQRPIRGGDRNSSSGNDIDSSGGNGKDSGGSKDAKMAEATKTAVADITDRKGGSRWHIRGNTGP